MNRNKQVNLQDFIVYDDKHPCDRQDGLREYRIVADVAWDLDVYDIVALYEKNVYDDMLFRVVEEDIDDEKRLWVAIRDANGGSPYDIIVENGIWYLA